MTESPSSEAGTPEATPPADDRGEPRLPASGGADAPPGMAPDTAVSLFDFIRTRRNVRFTLLYLAVGFAILQYLGVGLDPAWERYDLVMNLARVGYVVGAVLALTGAHLVLMGRHPQRTWVLLIVIAVSIAGGYRAAYVYEDWRRQGAQAGEENGPVETPGRQQQTPPSSPPPTINAGMGSLTPVGGTATPPTSTSAASGPAPDAAPVFSSETSPQSGPPLAPPPAAPPSGDAVPGADADVSDPVDARLQRLIAMFGAEDEQTFDTARPYPLLAQFDQPVTIRLGATSSGMIVNFQDNRFRQGRGVLTMRDRGDRVSDRIVIATGCGDFVYDFEAVMTETRSGTRPALARVTLRLDRAAARQAVSRAIELERCL